jgi:nicotinamidase/pyrazinamidase
MKTIFWNVDTQYDFMRADGRLYVQGAEAIEPNLERLTQYAAHERITVVNTADWHIPYDEEISGTPDFINTFPPHCIEGTAGAKYVPATEPVNPIILTGTELHYPYPKRNIIIYKHEFDTFKGNPLTRDVVDFLNPDRAVVYGVATNVCVDFAVKGLRERGIEVYVVKDAIKELPNIPVELVYDSWRASGVKFTTTEEVLSGTLEERL